MADDTDFLDDPANFTTRGVVRGGQIVLAAPLALPDGTVVTLEGMVEPAAADPPGPGQVGMLPEEVYRWFQEDLKYVKEQAAERAAAAARGRDAA